MADSHSPQPPSLEYLEQVTRSQRTLHAVLWSLLRNEADVDDVLQETNVALWRKADEFDPSRDFLAWALGIAQMQVLAFRKRQQRRKLVFDDELLNTLAAEAAQHASELEPRRAALAACLQKLPEEHRHLVTRRYEPGGSVNEIAQEQGKTPKAVSEMLRRIRAALLECIERTVAREAHA